MNIKIYQIDTEKDKNNVKFTGYDELSKYQHNSEIDASLYTEVFSGDVDRETLEGIYEQFNTEMHPLHCGHSLSVSDIVKTNDGTFYCDRVGFKKVDFDETKTHKPENLIKVVFVEPDKPAVVAEIENKLRGLQRAVGGNIEALYYKDGTCLVCNEEGKLNGLKGNRKLAEFGGEIIAGSFFIAGVHEDEFRSLTEKEIEKYMSRFKDPEEISDEEVIGGIGIKFYPM